MKYHLMKSVEYVKCTSFADQSASKASLLCILKIHSKGSYSPIHFPYMIDTAEIQLKSTLHSTRKSFIEWSRKRYFHTKRKQEWIMNSESWILSDFFSQDSSMSARRKYHNHLSILSILPFINFSLWLRRIFEMLPRSDEDRRRMCIEWHKI